MDIAPQAWSEDRRVRLLRRWMWLIVLIVGLVLFFLTQQTVLVTDNPRLIPGMVLLGALVAPAACVAAIWPRAVAAEADRVLPSQLAIAIGFGGGIVAVIVAALVEYGFLASSGGLPALAVGLIEETAKLIVPAVVIVGLRLTPGAGLALGVTAGTSFGLIETLGYAFVAYVGSGDTLAAVDADLLSRSVFTPATHLAWTGIAAVALAGVCAAQTLRAVVGFVAVFGIVVLLHTSWDTWSSLGVYAALSGVSIGLLLLALHLARRPGPAAGDMAPTGS